MIFQWCAKLKRIELLVNKKRTSSACASPYGPEIFAILTFITITPAIWQQRAREDDVTRLYDAKQTPFPKQSFFLKLAELMSRSIQPGCQSPLQLWIMGMNSVAYSDLVVAQDYLIRYCSGLDLLIRQVHVRISLGQLEFCQGCTVYSTTNLFIFHLGIY